MAWQLCRASCAWLHACSRRPAAPARQPTQAKTAAQPAPPCMCPRLSPHADGEGGAAARTVEVPHAAAWRPEAAHVLQVRCCVSSTGLLSCWAGCQMVCVPCPGVPCAAAAALQHCGSGVAGRRPADAAFLRPPAPMCSHTLPAPPPLIGNGVAAAARGVAKKPSKPAKKRPRKR